MAKFNDFQWEDEDESSTQKTEQDQRDEFQQLLETEKRGHIPLHVGQKVPGTIISLKQDSDTVLVELSSSQTGVIDKKDLLNDEGILEAKLGDQVEFFVVSKRDGSIQLSSGIGKSQQATKDLEMAFDHQIPVKGKIVKDIKGGFEVTVFGKRAFCPVSGIDHKFVEDKSQFINRDLDFMIEKYENNGRNIVVSRAKIIQKEREARLDHLNKIAGSDSIIEGRVTDIRDYGALVDLEAIEGFLHISEISYARVTHVTDVLTRGETIRVKVLKVEHQGDRPRISLSMKAVEQDPWETVAQDFKAQESYPGKVVRLSKHGAFIQLKPGLDGLLHLSEMSWEKRIYDPTEVLNLGDDVTVRILTIDREAKRISLSLKDLGADPWKDIETRWPIGTATKGKVERLKGFGAIVELAPGLSGLLPTGTLKQAFGEGYRRQASPPKEIEVLVSKVDREEQKILLSLPQVQSDDDGEDFREYLGSKQKASQKTSVSQGSFGDLLAAKLNEQKK